MTKRKSKGAQGQKQADSCQYRQAGAPLGNRTKAFEILERLRNRGVPGRQYAGEHPYRPAAPRREVHGCLAILTGRLCHLSVNWFALLHERRLDVGDCVVKLGRFSGLPGHLTQAIPCEMAGSGQLGDLVSRIVIQPDTRTYISGEDR